MLPPAQVYAGFELRPDLVHGVVVPPRHRAHGSERPHATARVEPRGMGRGIAWRLARMQMTQAAEARAAAALKAEFRADIVHSLEVELEARGPSHLRCSPPSLIGPLSLVVGVVARATTRRSTDSACASDDSTRSLQVRRVTSHAVRLPAFVLNYSHGTALSVNRELIAERHTAVVCGSSGNVGGDELISENKARTGSPLHCAGEAVKAAEMVPRTDSPSRRNHRREQRAAPWRRCPASCWTPCRPAPSISERRGLSGCSSRVSLERWRCVAASRGTHMRVLSRPRLRNLTRNARHDL